MSDQPTENQPAQDQPAQPDAARGTDRRTVLRAAGVVTVGVAGAGALAACGGSTTPSTGSGGGGGGGAGSTSASGSASGSASSGGSGSSGTSVKTSTVPVGGGVINTDQLFVVTQPTAGQFKAFSATCTHQGCPVDKVQNGFIECPCHGSKFDITTGAPTSSSQAKKALPAKTATVNGDSVVIS